MKKRRRARRWIIAGAVVLFLGLAGLIGAVGCGEEDGVTMTTVVARADKQAVSEAGASFADEAAFEPEAAETAGLGETVDATLDALEAAADRKIISNAQLDIEVSAGEFQKAFDQASLLALRYGGYVLSSSAYASGEENVLKSGTVVLRIPAQSFERAKSDATKLGELKNQNVWTDDVTEEYVDIQSRIRTTQLIVDEILGLLAEAKTIDEILRIQQIVAPYQERLEQLNGRMRYLDEQTSYSTLTLNIFESGVEVTPPSEWGFVEALKDALHNIVDGFSAVVRGLGWLIPVIVIVGVIAYIIYRVVRAGVRHSRQRQEKAAGEDKEKEGQTS